MAQVKNDSVYLALYKSAMWTVMTPDISYVPQAFSMLLEQHNGFYKI